MENIRDLYTDYLLSSFGQSTATSLSSMLDGSVSHDRITRHLSGGDFGGKEHWSAVKPLVKEHRSDDACTIFDDTVIEKLFSKAEVTKNELFRDMVGQVVHNQLPFRYVLADSWFCSNDNMGAIDKKDKYFIFEIKADRLACRDGTERDKGQWKGIRETVASDAPVEVYLKGLDIKGLLARQVFTNKDGSTGERRPVSNDLGLDDAGFMAVYKKRWGVEEYHKGPNRTPRRAGRPQTP